MKFTPTDIADVKLVELERHADERGYFMEAWRTDRFVDAGIAGPWVQDNVSRSIRNVLRGIHYQIEQPQGKLVRVSRGRVFDVAVDLRRASSTFGQWVGHQLSDENNSMLWIPPGFGHAFLTLSDEADVHYKCTDFYAPAHDRTIVWNDPDLGIAWPLESDQMPVLSAKDAAGAAFRKADIFS